MPLTRNPQVAKQYEEKIRRLKKELRGTRYIIIQLMPENIQQILMTYHSYASPEDISQWAFEVRKSIIDLAKPITPEWHSSIRGLCPLCGLGSSTPYESGFTIPEGLNRHLTGWGNVPQCNVMAVATSLAYDHLKRK